MPTAVWLIRPTPGLAIDGNLWFVSMTVHRDPTVWFYVGSLSLRHLGFGGWTCTSNVQVEGRLTYCRVASVH